MTHALVCLGFVAATLLTAFLVLVSLLLWHGLTLIGCSYPTANLREFVAAVLQRPWLHLAMLCLAMLPLPLLFTDALST